MLYKTGKVTLPFLTLVCYFQEDTDSKLKPPKKKKALSKAAQAKKLLKKNIKANTKIMFDDDGQVRNFIKTEMQF